MDIWSGRDSETIRDIFVNLDVYSKIKNMQTHLLLAGAKKAQLWYRMFEDEENYSLCPCVKDSPSTLPQKPHSICYGTGIVGGYRKYGYKELIVYRKNAQEVLNIDDYKTNYDIDIVGNTIETDWIDLDQDIIAGTKIIYYNYGNTMSKVLFSTDGANWRQELALYPASKFKIRITDIDNLFECVRFRIQVKPQPFILLSERPPSRLIALIREGLKENPFDIECWTIGSSVLYSGDLIRWMEGYYKGQFYSVSSVRVSQFVRTADESETLTQVLGMRRILPAEQLSRIW